MRMIDADALHAEISAWPESIMYKDWVQSAIANAPTLTQPNELERAGLYGKYIVLKNEDGSLVINCFVLRPEKDPAAVAALRAYAATTDNAELADDIINWIGAEPNEPLTLEELREVPHGKIKDSTLQSICDRANEIARRPPEGEGGDVGRG